MQSVTDAQLLDRFVKHQDDFSFEELVRRHSTMVMGVCHRVLGNTSDAEDAFQNAFLIFSQKAPSLVDIKSVGAWIHYVAFRSALKVRRSRAKHHNRFEFEDEMKNQSAYENPKTDTDELKAKLDEALGKLSEKYRAPLIACYLEGKNSEEAAAHCNLNSNTYRIRLMRGKELLKQRLVRQGVTLSATALAAILVQSRSAVASEVLIQSTVKLTTVKAAASMAGSASLLGITSQFFQELFYKKALRQALAVGMVVLFGGIVLKKFVIDKANPVQPLHSMVSTKAGESKDMGKMISGPVNAEDGVELPTSIGDYLTRLNGALLLDKSLRWQACRRLGLSLSDNDFAQIESTIEVGEFKKSSLKDQKHPNFHSALFSYWPQKNSKAAMEWVVRLQAFPSESLPPTAHFYRSSTGIAKIAGQAWLLHHVCKQWAEDDWKLLFEWSRKVEDEQIRTKCFTAIMDHLVQVDFERARSIMMEHPDLEQAAMLSPSSSLQMVNNDFLWAAERILKIQQEQVDGSHVNGVVRLVAQVWGAKDPRTAFEWVLTLLQNNPQRLTVKKDALRVISRIWTMKDPVGVTHWASQLSDKEARKVIFQQVALSWADINPEAAMNWANRLPQDGEREGIYQDIISVQLRKAAYERSYSIHELVAQIDQLPRSSQEALILDLIANYPVAEGQQLYEWMQGYPRGAFKELLIETYLKSGNASLLSGTKLTEQLNDSKKSPLTHSLEEKERQLQLAVESVLKSPISKTKKDEMISQICSLKQMSPHVAIPIAEKIHNPEKKKSALTVILKDWIAQDQTAAQQWIAQSALSQETKQSLLLK